jgi:hypothetical protein
MCVTEKRQDFHLDVQGFQLASDVPTNIYIADYYDDELLASKYNPQLKEWLLAQIPGAKEIQVLDHTRRSSTRNL